LAPTLFQNLNLRFAFSASELGLHK